MTGDECYFFMTHVLRASGETANSMMSEAAKQGWTLYHIIGPMRVCVSKVPLAQGHRSSEFQVTVK